MIREILVVSCLLYGIKAEFKDPLTCEESSSFDQSSTLSVNSKKTGKDWKTGFTAWKDSKALSKDFNAEVSQKVKYCGEREIVYIQGIVNGPDDKLTFHPNCGTNVGISNNGRTIHKIRREVDLNGVVFTSRPLKNNELFEVVLEKKDNLYSTSFGFGITTYSPVNFQIPNHMYNLKSGNWMLYGKTLSKNGEEQLKDYGQNLNNILVGDRVGVLRNNFGSLHFYVNGVDQGPAAANIPFPVYGVFELKDNAIQASIVDNS